MHVIHHGCPAGRDCEYSTCSDAVLSTLHVPMAWASCRHGWRAALQNHSDCPLPLGAGHENRKHCIFAAFLVTDPCAKRIVAGSEDGAVCFWDLQTKQARSACTLAIIGLHLPEMATNLLTLTLQSRRELLYADVIALHLLAYAGTAKNELLLHSRRWCSG